MEQLIRVRSVAKLLDVTNKRVYNLISEGKLEAINLGVRQTRITRESLLAYVERLRKRRRIEVGLEEDLETPIDQRRSIERGAATALRDR